MHPVAVFSKEHEGMSHNCVSPFPSVPWWSGLGSQPTDYEEHFAHQLKPPSKENPAIRKLLVAPNEADREREQGILGKERPSEFTISPGDWETSVDIQKFQLQKASSKPMSVADQEKHFEQGIRQPMICARYPYGEQFYGMFSTYAPQLTGRVMLPLNSTTDQGTIFVNAKQYNGILRRRQYRAKAEQAKKALKNRKPFLHLSRHLHAMRRPRGCGGRFLNTKTSNGNKGKNDDKNTGGEHLFWATGSQTSEVLQSVSGNSNSPRESNGSRSNNSGSEVTSMYFREDRDPFLMNHLRATVQTVPNTMNAGHTIALHNKWVVAADTCCNLEV